MNEDGKDSFLSKLKRGLAGLAPIVTSDTTDSQNPEDVHLDQSISFAEELDEPSKEVANFIIEDEIVITSEGSVHPQIQRVRGYASTITHVPKQGNRWLLEDTEAIADGEAIIDEPEQIVDALELIPPSEETMLDIGEPEYQVASEESSPNGSTLTGSQFEPIQLSMANNLKESLEELITIDGAVAVALVDGSSGMVMGTAGNSPLNLEVAAAGNSEVVRSKHKVMKALNLRENIEDILISLTTQYHVIRPLANNPQIFIYLVLNRSNANLAMARFKLKSVENDLQI